MNSSAKRKETFQTCGSAASNHLSVTWMSAGPRYDNLTNESATDESRGQSASKHYLELVS